MICEVKCKLNQRKALLGFKTMYIFNTNFYVTTKKSSYYFPSISFSWCIFVFAFLLNASWEESVHCWPHKPETFVWYYIKRNSLFCWENNFIFCCATGLILTGSFCLCLASSVRIEQGKKHSQYHVSRWFSSNSLSSFGCRSHWTVTVYVVIMILCYSCRDNNR